MKKYFTPELIETQQTGIDTITASPASSDSEKDNREGTAETVFGYLA